MRTDGTIRWSVQWPTLRLTLSLRDLPAVATREEVFASATRALARYRADTWRSGSVLRFRAGFATFGSSWVSILAGGHVETSEGPEAPRIGVSGSVMPLAVIAMVIAAFTLPEGAWATFTFLSALFVGGNLLVVLSGVRRLLRQVSSQAPAHPTL